MTDRELELRGEAPPSSVKDADAAIAANESFIEHGEHLRHRLKSFVHGEEAIRRAVRREVRRWQNEAFTVSRTTDHR